MELGTWDIEKDLDLLISRKAKIAPIVAKKWQWRILNEYPENLKELVFAWIKDEPLPEATYNDISVEKILDSTAFSFLDAVDLLYIAYKDPAAGQEIFFRSIRRDFIERR